MYLRYMKYPKIHCLHVAEESIMIKIRADETSDSTLPYIPCIRNHVRENNNKSTSYKIYPKSYNGL